MQRSKKFSVKVNTIRDAMLRLKQPRSTIFGLYFLRKYGQPTDPISYPRYTQLPSVPKPVFPKPISSLKSREPAGRIPLSIFKSKLEKNRQ